ncbi:MAG TPA: bifunctional hydroxymethylpyrimidine kinase/phosphomethylpyrimidine kinase, partial [Rhodospirillales bacterium]|nr:bifunctional hydroxymethylpyrimidine kinase/phosphomethylpyrimidine kinase [Rhodospirillales bacterium]
ALGGFGMTAITALTAQNTRGVFGILDVPPAFVAQQMRVVLGDIGADCIKIGMLHRPDIVEVVVAMLAEMAPDVPVVVDPVMVAKGGQSLLADAAVTSLRRLLLPLAAVLTPNLPEAAALLGEPTPLTSAAAAPDAVAIQAAAPQGADMPDYSASDSVAPEHLAARLLALGPRAVLLKGGHGAGPVLIDVLAEQGRPPERFASARIDTRHTHGTGCTLASAVACGLAQGLTLRDAVVRARAYVRAAIEAAPGYGEGHGPLGHGHTVRPFQPNPERSDTGRAAGIVDPPAPD